MKPEITRVFVLGAGASIGHSAGEFPGIKDFFAKAARLGLTQGDIAASEFRHLEKYCLERFGQSIGGSKNRIDVEELLTSLQIDIQRTLDASLMSGEKSLKDLIRTVLIRLSSGLRVAKSEYHEFEESLQVRDSVITFNWDLLLDRILMGAQETKGNQGGPNQYSNFVGKFALQEQPFPSFKEYPFESNVAFPYTAEDSVMPLYLKLHGSIDWFVCTNDSCKASGQLFIMIDPEKKYFCSECHELLLNLLIPPVLNKPLYESPVIRKMWNAAVRVVSAAKEVVIWGYSIPATDFYSRWLLRHARRGQLERIAIIDPAVVSGRKQKSLQKQYLERALSIFAGLDRRLEVKLYESFGDYREGLDVLFKYPEAKIPISLAEFFLNR